MEFKTTCSKQRALQSGMTLVEVMVGVAIASLVFAIVAVFSFHAARGSASAVNYVGLASQNRMAVDVMSKKLRQASAITAFGPGEITAMLNGRSVRYYYDARTRSVMEEAGGRSRVLLEGVDAFGFELYQRNAVAGSFEQVPAGGSPRAAKLVQMNWRTSRTTSVLPTQTDRVVSVRVALRAK